MAYAQGYGAASSPLYINTTTTINHFSQRDLCCSPHLGCCPEPLRTYVWLLHLLAPRTCAALAGGRAPPSRCSTSASGSGSTSAIARPHSSAIASANPNASASANPSANDSARVDIGHRKALAQSQPLWQHEELETRDARDRCGRGPPALRQLRVVVSEKSTVQLHGSVPSGASGAPQPPSRAPCARRGWGHWR